MDIQDADLTRKNDQRHVLHSWSAGGAQLPVISRGQGSWFWDHDGKRYLDLASQRMNLALGHQHPRMIAAIKRQAGKLCTAASIFAVDSRSEAATLIAQVAPGELDAVFFTSGGADAIEHATRMARLHTGRHKILSAYRSYHGSSAGALSLTGDNRRMQSEEWQMPGVVHFFGPYLYRSHFQAASASEECARALHHLHETVIYEGPDRIAGILMETVVGTNGILVPPEGYLQGVREICDRYGILLILDEVMCGFGRCGRWFATERWNVEPDVIVFAKGVNSGYVPLGGVLLSRAVADTFQRVRPYPGGMTYSGHPLACATAVESIRIFEDENILGHVQELESEVYGPKLHELAQRHPAVGDVRGVGAFWAIELVRDRETREPLLDGEGTDGPLRRFNARCRGNGVWPFTYANRIHLVPPLNISREELVMGLEVIDEALAECDGYVA